MQTSTFFLVDAHSNSCPKCGASIEGESKSCGSCGSVSLILPFYSLLHCALHFLVLYFLVNSRHLPRVPGIRLHISGPCRNANANANAVQYSLAPSKTPVLCPMRDPCLCVNAWGKKRQRREGRREIIWLGRGGSVLCSAVLSMMGIGVGKKLLMRYDAM